MVGELGLGVVKYTGVPISQWSSRDLNSTEGVLLMNLTMSFHCSVPWFPLTQKVASNALFLYNRDEQLFCLERYLMSFGVLLRASSLSPRPPPPDL